MSDTIERAQEIYDLCLEQEQKYTFETFSKQMHFVLVLLWTRFQKTTIRALQLKSQ